MENRMKETHDQGTAANAPEAGAASPDPGAATTPAVDVPEPATLQDALTVLGELRAAIASRDEEISKLRDQLLRERADLENFKKRMTREKSEALRFAVEPLIRELLPAIDNLERALGAAGPAPEGESDPLREGVAMVAKQFNDILSKFGVERLEATGQPFDPSQHDALAHVETTRREPGSVLDEHLPGYRLHDRLLRPAQVTVAKAPTGEGN